MESKINHSICLIVPYFGKFPNYFDMWLYSCGQNKDISFLLISNNDRPEKLPENFIYIKEEFYETVRRFQNCYDFPICLDSPYKFCDFRPAYGEVFSKELEGYDFWGFVDVDLILGNVRKCLTDEILDSYDKFYVHGHLTVFRNTRELNLLYRNMDYRKVFSHSYPFHFDEGGGISEYYSKYGLKQYFNVDMADILPFRYRFSNTSEDIGRFPQIYRYHDGKVICIYEEKGELKEREYIYMHLQKRPMERNNRSIESYYVIPNEFLDIDDKDIASCVKEQAKQRICWHWKKARSKELWTNIKKGAIRFQLEMLLSKLHIMKGIV